MSKFALFSGITGVGTAGAVAAGMAMGVIDMPEWMRGKSAEPAAVVSSENAAKPEVKADAPVVAKAVTEDAGTPAPTGVAPDDTVAEPAPDAVLPGFDLVRAEPGGSTLVAGAAEPGHIVNVMLNGSAIAEATVGADGKFVAFVDLPAGNGGHVLSLESVLGETRLVSEDQVIIAPVALTDVAEAEADLVDDAELVVVEDTPVASDATQTELADSGVITTEPPAEETDVLALADVPQPRVPGGQGPTAPTTVTVDTGVAVPAQVGSEVAGKTDAPKEPRVVSGPTVAGIDGATRESALVPKADTEGPGAMTAPAVENTLVAARSSDPVLASRRPQTQGRAPVAAAAPPAVLLATPRGVEVLQNAPLSPGEVALDAISYDAAGDVLLSGRGDQEAFVRIYLDNTPVTTSRIRDDGRWRVELPEVDAGTYTLRVDQVDTSGVVVSRVESPFLRESADVLEAATKDEGPVTSITVQPGNTLWAISKERYGDGVDYVKVFQANRDRIRNPDLIYPGQIFDLPD